MSRQTNYVIGDPVDHSLSPDIHNAAYEYLGITNKYLFDKKRLKDAEEIKDFLANNSFGGLAVTSPNKQAVMNFLDELDDAAEKIDAVNTVVNRTGKLIGYNTDYIGVIGALEEVTDLHGKKVAVLGTSGSARAISFALQQRDIQTTIFGRNTQKVIEIAKEFEAMPADIQAKGEMAGHDIIINATSVGMDKNNQDELIPESLIESGHIIFDLVYSPTKLVESARRAGAKVIEGKDMLINQAAPQIKLMTGADIDVSKLRDLLGWTMS